MEALRGIEAKMIKFKVPMPNLKAILRFGIPPLLRYDPSDTLQTELDATHMVLTFGHMYQLRQNVFMGKSPAAAKEEMIDALEVRACIVASADNRCFSVPWVTCTRSTLRKLVVHRHQ